MNEFIQAFEESLDLPAGSVNADTEFKDLAEWDSLAQLATMTLIEDIYRKMVDPAMLRSSRTIGDLIARVKAA